MPLNPLLQYQNKTQPVLVPPGPAPGDAAYSVDSPFPFEIIDNRAVIYPSYQGPVYVTVEAITEDKWHFSWSEPIRLRPRLLDCQQQFFAAPLNPIELIYEDKWNFPWSEPVRVRARTAETTIAFIAPQPVPPALQWPIYTLVGALEIKIEMVGY